MLESEFAATGHTHDVRNALAQLGEAVETLMCAGLTRARNEIPDTYAWVSNELETGNARLQVRIDFEQAVVISLFLINNAGVEVQIFKVIGKLGAPN